MTIGKLGGDGTDDFKRLTEMRATLAQELGLAMDVGGKWMFLARFQRFCP